MSLVKKSRTFAPVRRAKMRPFYFRPDLFTPEGFGLGIEGVRVVTGGSFPARFLEDRFFDLAMTRPDIGCVHLAALLASVGAAACATASAARGFRRGH